ncbi:MAG: M28 family peptidase [Bacteriovoracaceae bacterium]|nr:M28 family peptidase [Bacteriovoracaceae bacterium]
MKKISLLALALLTSGVLAKPFQIITDNESKIKEIESLSYNLQKIGRLHTVEISDNNFNQLSIIAKKGLRSIDLSTIKNYSYSLPKASRFNSNTAMTVEEIKTENLTSIIEHLSSYKSRYIGAQGNRDSVEWVLNRFKSYGLELKKECYSVGWFGKKACNAIGIKKATDPKAKTIVVMAHLDSVGKAYAGAEDNGSGIAAVIELARIMKDIPTKMNIEFIAVNAEEVGIVGSKKYVTNLTKVGRKDEIHLALTMDMIGFNSGNLYSIETSEKYEKQAKRLAEYGKLYGNRNIRINLKPWGSDHMSFIKGGIPGILTAQDWANHNPCYHKACDTIDKIDFEYLRDIAKANLAYLLEESTL